MNPGAPNAGGAPPSFKTNVNRAKTKRWVEAKSYTYDGDDWGDADDYDEYGGYDEPAPAQKPTGLRQAGQSAPSPAGNNLPPQNSSRAPDTQQQYGPPRPSYQQPERERANSFGRRDERRAFSGPGPNLTSPMRTAYSQSPGMPVEERGQQQPPVQAGAPRIQQPTPQPGQPRRPSFDQQGRPAAQGAPRSYLDRPQQVADGSRSQSMTSSTPSADFQRREFSNTSAIPQPLHTARPPRKSSLGQQEAPIRGPGPISPISTDVVSTETASSNATRDRSQGGSAPTPTFVRPADIYRRLQEEREKERLSQESSRPSMDVIMGGRSSRDESPAGRSGDDSDAPRRRKPALESVAERKSEYGMEGLLSVNKANAQGLSRAANESPSLPEIPGFGESFGEGFGNSFLGSVHAGNPSKPEGIQPQRTLSPDTAATSQPADLQHQPSRGFRSVVHQAFDEPAIPQTPSSTTDSMARSNSESTNAISPIISRAPSTADPPSIDTKIESIAEEPIPTTPNQTSAESPSTPKAQDARAESPELPPAFIPGHRRNTSTPSPGNSPARTPAIEVNRQLRNPQEVEIAVATPTSMTHSASSASDKPAGPEPTSHGIPSRGANTVERSQLPSTVAPITTTRAGSPTKGRVRDLADKFDSANNSRRNSDSSLKETARLDAPSLQRPQGDRNESFRPQLPGGWVSYADNVPNQQKTSPRPVTPQQGPDPLEALRNAGNALAGAITSAAGLNEGPYSERAESGDRGRTSTRDMTIHPEALMVPTHVDDANSSIVPTPMDMKDGGHPGYFAPVVPLKQKSRGSSFSDLPALSKTHGLEDMSTENSPNDLESDRLRKELVRELSPHVESFDESVISKRGQDDSTAQNPSRTHTQDSIGLPSEYDSYWNGSVDGNNLSRKQSHAEDTRVQSNSIAPQLTFSPIQEPYERNANILSPNRNDSEDSLQVEHSLVHRFSWEPLPEELNAGASAAPLNETNQPQDLSTEGQEKDLHNAFTPSGPKPNINKDLPVGPAIDGTADPGLQRQLETDAQILQNIPPQSVPLQNANPQNIPLRDTPPPNMVPQNISQPDITSQNTSQPNITSQIIPSDSPSRENPLPSLPTTEPTKIPAFREIMALKTPRERIDTFNTTREQFASMNTGLANWITATTNRFPEHAHLLRSGGVYGVQTQGSRVASGAHPGMSNASSMPSSTTGKSGFSPGGGKITTQQVQAKGKDLLHSTKLFGGKANNTAKGLFAKGKSRFRSGGGDKVDT